MTIEADFLFTGGTVYADPTIAASSADIPVAVSGGRIVGLGRAALAARGKSTRVVSLKGKALIPGFYDAHQHQIRKGLALSNIDATAPDIGVLMGRVADRVGAEKNGEGWLQGFGYDDADLGRHPTRHDLDRVAPSNPTFLVRTCSHMLVANSAALALAGISEATPDPDGGLIDREADGRPSGLLRESAMQLLRRVVPQPTHAQNRAAILAAGNDNLDAGITSVWEAALEPQQLDAYLELEAEASLPIRVALAMRRVGSDGQPVPLPERWRREWLSMCGVKLILDGAIGPKTAASSAGYLGEPANQGLLMYSAEQLLAEITAIHSAGLQASIHAIGDLAIEAILDAVEALPADQAGLLAGYRHRVRIEHCGMANPALQARFALAGIIAVVQSPFLFFQGDTFLRTLSSEVCRWLYPIKSLRDSCIAVAGSSDAPVVPDASPLKGIEAAMLRRTKSGAVIAADEALDFQAALDLYTRAAAFASREEDIKGSIAVGKAADLIVLGEDPSHVQLDEISQIPLEMVLLDGRQVRGSS